MCMSYAKCGNVPLQQQQHMLFDDFVLFLSAVLLFCPVFVVYHVVFILLFSIKSQQISKYLWKLSQVKNMCVTWLNVRWARWLRFWFRLVLLIGTEVEVFHCFFSSFFLLQFFNQRTTSTHYFTANNARYFDDFKWICMKWAIQVEAKVDKQM